jgi:hypothetical protein
MVTISSNTTIILTNDRNNDFSSMTTTICITSIPSHPSFNTGSNNHSTLLSPNIIMADLSISTGIPQHTRMTDHHYSDAYSQIGNLTAL